MKKTFGFSVLTAIFGLFLMAGNLHAHSALVSSAPGHEQAVSEVEELKLGFNEPLRLLRLRLVAADESEVDFGFAPNASPQAEFAFEMPELSEGSYVAHWTVIGSDGHTVSDSFEFTVDSTAPAASSSEQHQHDHHHH